MGDVETAPDDRGPERKEFIEALREIENAARDWGVRSELPEGRFVTALMVAIGLTGRVSEAARDEFRRLFAENRKTAEIELQRVQEMTKTADLAVRRAQAAEVGFICEREAVTQKMIEKTLPVVAESLKTLLVVRERAWNRKVLMKHYGLAAVIALGVFVGGYTLRDWAEVTPSQRVNQCMTHSLVLGGRYYCDLDVMLGTGK